MKSKECVICYDDIVVEAESQHLLFTPDGKTNKFPPLVCSCGLCMCRNCAIAYSLDYIQRDEVRCPICRSRYDPAKIITTLGPKTNAFLKARRKLLDTTIEEIRISLIPLTEFVNNMKQVRKTLLNHIANQDNIGIISHYCIWPKVDIVNCDKVIYNVWDHIPPCLRQINIWYEPRSASIADDDWFTRKMIAIFNMYLNNDRYIHIERVDTRALSSDKAIYRKTITRKNKSITYQYDGPWSISTNSTLPEIDEVGVEAPRNECYDYDCTGFTTLKDNTETCMVCNKQFCAACKELKGEDHVCNEDTLASLAEIIKETKPCPKCGVRIVRSSGCADMFCTHCKTGFSWRTGEIIHGHFHNPHRARWLRQNIADFGCNATTLTLPKDELVVICSTKESFIAAVQNSPFSILQQLIDPRGCSPGTNDIYLKTCAINRCIYQLERDQRQSYETFKRFVKNLQFGYYTKTQYTQHRNHMDHSLYFIEASLSILRYYQEYLTNILRILYIKEMDVYDYIMSHCKPIYKFKVNPNYINHYIANTMDIIIPALRLGSNNGNRLTITIMRGNAMFHHHMCYNYFTDTKDIVEKNINIYNLSMDELIEAYCPDMNLHEIAKQVQEKLNYIASKCIGRNPIDISFI